MCRLLICLALLPALFHGCAKPAPKPAPLVVFAASGGFSSDTIVERNLWDHRPSLRPPTDPPPAHIHVCAYTYHVRYTSADALASRNSLAMSCHDGVREIWLDPKRVTDLRVDVMHELMHAAKDLGTSGSRAVMNWGDDDENVIATTSPSLVEILQDNPKLLSWLARARR